MSDPRDPPRATLRRTLAARSGLQLRLTKMIFVFGDFTLDESTFELRGPNGVVPLERRVFDLLAHLVRNCNRVVTKEELFRVVWTDRVVSDASLSVAIAALRRGLGDDPRNPQYVTTIHGRGYRFTQNVETHSTERLASPHRTAPTLSSLVGRKKELELIERSLARAKTGEVQVVLIAGEAGIGKTHLIEAFLNTARETGHATAVGRCPEEPGAPAFWPWIQVIRQRLDAIPALELAPMLEGCEEIIELIPELASKVSTSAAPQLQNPQQARFRLFEAVIEVIARAAQQSPLVVAFDDIHRADEASLALLSHLAASKQPVPLLLICSHRVPLKAHLALGTVARLARLPNELSLVLEGLSEDDARFLLQSHAPSHSSPEVGYQLHRESGGNPFFLIQLARNLSRAAPEGTRPGLPSSLASLLTVELGRLSRDATEILSVAACAGSEFSVALLGLATGVSLDSLRPLLQECEDEFLIVPAESPLRFRFRHDLLRQAIYESLSTARRSRLHGQIADAFLELTPDVPGPQLATLAHHLFESASSDRLSTAIAIAIRAGDWSSSCFAHEEAAVHYERALELMDLAANCDERERCSLLVALGTQLIRAGSRQLARRAFDHASKIARRIGAATIVAEAALAVAPGVLALESGVVDSFLIELLETALHELGTENAATRSKLLASLSVALHWSDDPEIVRRLASEANDVANSVDDRMAQTYSLQALWSASHGPSFQQDREQIAEKLVAEAGDRNPESSLVSRLFLLYSLLERGDMAGFDQHAVSFRELAEQLRQPQALWYAELLSAMRSMLVGDFDAAVRAREQFTMLGQRANDANAIHSALAHGTLICFEQGDVSGLVSTARDMGMRYPTVHVWRAAEAWLLALTGDYVSASKKARAVSMIPLREPSRMDWCGTLALLGETAAITGDVELARDVFDRLKPLADSYIVLGLCTLCWGSADRVLGLLADRLGRHTEATHYLRKAIDADKRIGARPWVARSQVSLVRVISQQRRIPASLKASTFDLLSEATCTAEALAMTRLLSEISNLKRGIA